MTRTALIVHDDESTLESVSSLLTLRGFKVLAARSPLHAVDLFAEHPLDVILLGLTAIEDREIEAVSIFRRRCPDATILLLFPERLRERAAEALIHGGDAYLPEPFYPRELLALALPREVEPRQPHVRTETVRPAIAPASSAPSGGTAEGAASGAPSVRDPTARDAPAGGAPPARTSPARTSSRVRPASPSSPVRPLSEPSATGAEDTAARPPARGEAAHAPGERRTPAAGSPSPHAPPTHHHGPALPDVAARADLEALAAHVAHEIRNPLQILELLLSRAESGAEVDVSGLRAELDRIAAVVRSLTRAPGEPGADEEVVDVDELVREVFAADPAEEDTGEIVDFIIETRPIHALVAGSPELLRTALELLRARAAGLSSPGASVTVRVILDRRAAPGAVRPAAGARPVAAAGGDAAAATASVGGAVRIDVEDGGVAPDDRTLARMFSQTEEDDPSDPTTPFELAAFAEIVRSHGGRAEAHRGPRGGTLIRTSLPLHGRAPAAGLAPSDSGTGAPPSRRDPARERPTHGERSRSAGTARSRQEPNDGGLRAG